jgi:hypothetical protein
MRVDYTLPTLQPAISPDVSSAPTEVTPSFRDYLRLDSVPLPSNWEQQLHLTERPFTASYIGPPPRPRIFEISDAETERVRWRSMLWRHTPPPGGPSSSEGGSIALRAMMNMLQQMQDMEDSIVAKSVAVTRG